MLYPEWVLGPRSLPSHDCSACHKHYPLGCSMLDALSCMCGVCCPFVLYVSLCMWTLPSWSKVFPAAVICVREQEASHPFSLYGILFPW